MLVEALEHSQEIPSGSLKMVRTAVQRQRDWPKASAIRINKALYFAGFHADDALPRAEMKSCRSLDDLEHKPIRIYGCDEEKAEGRQLNIRLYAAKERAIKKRDCHHRRQNNEKLTIHKSGLQGAFAALKLVMSNNNKPFGSHQFGIDKAESAGYYLSEFGPDSAESDGLVQAILCKAPGGSCPRTRGLKGHP